MTAAMRLSRSSPAAADTAAPSCWTNSNTLALFCCSWFSFLSLMSSHGFPIGFIFWCLIRLLLHPGLHWPVTWRVLWTQTHCHFYFRQADWSPLHPWSEPYWLPDLQVGHSVRAHFFSPVSGGSNILTLNHRYLIDVDGMDPLRAVECECWCRLSFSNMRTNCSRPNQSKWTFVLSVQLVSGPLHGEEELPGWPAIRTKEEVTQIQAWVCMFLCQVNPGWNFHFLLTFLIE